MRKILLSIFFLPLINVIHIKAPTHNFTPDITVVFVIDQLAHHTLKKYCPHLKYGIKTLLKQGVSFENNLHHHAMPYTPPGHAAISTGAQPWLHGINSYGFVDKQNSFIEITQDDNPDHATFGESDTVLTGRSPKYLMADTVADQFLLSSLNSSSEKGHEAAAFAIKPRASIPLAGHMGKAIWFDDQSGYLTSSKYYYKDGMPVWLKTFNQKNRSIKDGTTLKWTLMYNENCSAYKFPEIENYDHAFLTPKKYRHKKCKIDLSKKDPFAEFKRSPFASRLLCLAAKKYIRMNYRKNNKLLVYISFSNFDQLGHLVGPDALEMADLLYHLDYQIGQVINCVNSLYGSKKSLFILTSDHGISHIPEILNKQGLKAAERIDANKMLEKISSAVEKDLGYKDIIAHFEAPQIYLKRTIVDNLSEVKQIQLYNKIKEVLLQEPYISDAWSSFDFEHNSGNINKHKHYYDLFCKQYFRGRSGNIIYLTHPHKMVSSYPTGTSHTTPYRHDTHVPLIIYQRLKFRPQQVFEPTSALNLAATQSFLMGITPPSCAEKDFLPGLRLFKHTF